MKSKITLAQFQKWARTNEGLAADLIAKRIVAKSERARVDAYIEPIFATFTFTDDEGQRITRSHDLYTAAEGQEQQIQAFYEATYDAHTAHGFTGERGRCPALSAENAAIQAENALIDSGCKVIGVKPGLVYGKHRDELIALLLGACGFEQKVAA